MISVVLVYIEQAKYLQEYQIEIKFTNGTLKKVDLRESLHGEILEPLKDLNVFKSFYLNHDTQTIEWSNGADFAPAYLYDL